MAAPPPGTPKSTTATNAGGIASGPAKCYAFKSWLQEYAQKADLPYPEYHTVKEGPAHEPVFRSSVLIDGAKYDSLPGFFTRKAAEQSAAEAALMEIVESIPTNQRITAAQETGLWKSLLQEYAQEMNYSIPSYTWTRQASGKAPYACTVEIGGIQYIGHAGRSKKETEIKASWTGLLAIKGQLEGSAGGATKYIVVPGKRRCNEAEKKTIETLKPFEVKKLGFKKKWNKRKFMNRTRQAVDLEKNEVSGAEDVSNVTSLRSQKPTQESSRDTLMLKHDEEQPYKEARRVEQELGAAMLKPDDEDRRVKQVLAGGTAMLQHANEARRVEQVQGGGTAMLQPDKEARSVKQEPGSSTVKLQPDNEAGRVEQEPPRDSGMVQLNVKAGCIHQEQLGETEIPRCAREARTKKHDPQSRCNLM